MTSLNNIKGWKPWILTRSTWSNNGNKQLLDAAFPPSYIPSKTFWVKSDISHCLIPWTSYSTGLREAGGHFTPTNIQEALQSVGSIQNRLASPAIGTWGYKRPNVGPELGYCMGNVFHQQVYVYFSMTNNDITGGIILLNYGVDLIQNSRSKKMYVKRGMVSSVSSFKSTYTLSLDVNSSVSPPSSVSVSGSIRLYNHDAQGKITTATFTIQKLDSNWGVVVPKPEEENPLFVPKSGDYYELSNPWIIEDPFLLSGDWEGVDPATGTYVTSQQRYNTYSAKTGGSYTNLQASIKGVYIYQSKNGTILSPPAGTSMVSTEDSEWTFFPFDNNDKNRPQETVLTAADSDGSTVKLETMKNADASDLQKLLENKNTTYLRLDWRFKNGDNLMRSMRNFYAPCLSGEFIQFLGNGIYKIIAQPSTGIIDVSLTPLNLDEGSGEVKNIQTVTNCSIINQKAWFIVEHYDTKLPDASSSKGMFRGNISSATLSGGNTAITLKGDAINWGAWASSGMDDPNVYADTLTRNCFLQRYTKTHQPFNSKEPLQLYEKFNGWYIVFVSNGNTAQLLRIQFSQIPSQAGDSYTASVIATGNLSVDGKGDFSNIIGTDVYLAFGQPFDTYYPQKRESSWLLNLGVEAGEYNPAFGASTNLCLEGSYYSSMFSVYLSNSTRVGFCDGYLFGVGTNGSASSSIGQFTWVTVKGANGLGLASVYDTLKQEDNLFFRDKNTYIMTQRKGVLDFRDRPAKKEIVVGELDNPILLTTNGKQITISSDNAKNKRLKSLVHKNLMEGEGENISFVYYIGKNNLNNTYGFPVNGTGQVDLQTFRINGKAAGSIPSSTWKYKDIKVSPVYTYKKNPSLFLQDSVTVDVGISPDDKYVFLSSQASSHIEGIYVDDYKVMKDGNDDCSALLLPTGQILYIYNVSPGAFTLNGTIYNSAYKKNQWVGTDNAIMFIEGENGLDSWCTPLFSANQNYTLKDFNYPLMILTGVDHISSLYDDISERLFIFVKGYMFESGTSQTSSTTTAFLGCYTISILNLLYSGNAYLGNPTTDNGGSLAEGNKKMKFIYRPPLAADAKDNTKNWTDYDHNQIDIKQYESKSVCNDTFIRILGPKNTNCKIESDIDIKYPSASKLYNGIFMVLYDSIKGTKAAFSWDEGTTWSSSDIIMCPSNIANMQLDGLLFYATAEGIWIKHTKGLYFDGAIMIVQNKIAGIDTKKIEKEVQDYFDNAKSNLIYSDALSFSKLSGYVTDAGTIKVFFYNSDQLVICIQSFDCGDSWSVAENF